MNQNRPSSSTSCRQSGPPQESARPWVLALILLIGLGGGGFLVAALLHWTGDRESSASIATTNAEATGGSSDEAAGTVKTRRPRGGAYGFASETSSSGAGTDGDASWPEASPETKKLVQSLGDIDPNPDNLTPEKAESWKRKLRDLQDQGAAAVPAIHEFLQRNVDKKFDPDSASKLLGERSVRTALIKTLFDIPEPDNVRLQAKVLQTTLDPDEIVLLARQLELQAPGQFRDAIIEAAKAALQDAKNRNRPDGETSMLIKLLERYGVSELR